MLIAIMSLVLCLYVGLS